MADKTLKSLNFGGADNYFPLPLVTAADNDKILSVVNGEWAVIDFPGNSGEYVWSRQYAGSSVTGDFTGGTYTLTTTNDTTPSSEIEYSANAPTYNIATKKWEMADSTIVTLTNADNTVPSFSGNMYVRLTSAPNVWYLATAINVTGSGPYSKSLIYSAKYTAAIDNSYVEYAAGSTEGKYPDGGWSDGAWYTLKLRVAAAANVFTFTITFGGGSTPYNTFDYQAEEGMTWGEFASSKYNSNGDFVIDESRIRFTKNYGSAPMPPTAGVVSVTDIITDSDKYIYMGSTLDKCYVYVEGEIF